MKLKVEDCFWLKDNFVLVYEEFIEIKFEVMGVILFELNGCYFCNGVNLLFGDMFYWFFGYGMIYGVELNGGNVNWY